MAGMKDSDRDNMGCKTYRKFSFSPLHKMFANKDLVP
jgi:hypothetical protein